MDPFGLIHGPQSGCDGQPGPEGQRPRLEFLNTSCPGLHVSSRRGTYMRDGGIARGNLSYNELPVYS